MLLFWAVLLVVALVTYDPLDPTLNQSVSDGWTITNAAGPVGSYAAGLLADLFGLAGWLAPLALAAAGVGCFLRGLTPAWWRWLGLCLFGVTVMGLSASTWSLEHVRLGAMAGGGFLGAVLHAWVTYFLRPTGAGILAAFSLLIGVQLMAGMTWGGMFKRVRGRWLDLRFKLRERSGRRRRLQRTQTSPDDAPMVDMDAARKKPKRKSRAKAAPAASTPPADDSPTGAPPAVDVLDVPPENTFAVDKDELEDASGRLTACLEDFGIQGEVQDVTPGPVVTMFEYKPAPGVKISRIANLSDDLSLALKAAAVRIEAPLPGRDTVGVEIPNRHRQTVYLREILDSKEFKASTSPLSMAIGKDIFGTPRVADLAKMPHLLVAGATGQGKSVCINSILVSFLYKAGPDRLRLLLIDPKRIELSLYSELPHLVHPVVTDMSVAKNALDWAVHEMEQRYEAMAQIGVRNIEGYNEKIAKKGETIPDDLLERGPMPYIVIIIDEMADLMLTARKEVETSIVRLAQLARAAGMHMILATQRPSVDVVTGLIKANFPSRIAFTVTSPQDSRTILDTVGANHLLGKGDMLFKPGGGKNVRLHGALVNEEEIGRVIEHWKRQAPTEFELDFSKWGPGGDAAGGEEGVIAGDDQGVKEDPVYPQAMDFVLEQGKASISLIQRRFRIGFNRAARFVEQMERDGIVGPADGSKPREVIGGRD